MRHATLIATTVVVACSDEDKPPSGRATIVALLSQIGLASVVRAFFASLILQNLHYRDLFDPSEVNCPNVCCDSYCRNRAAAEAACDTDVMTYFPKIKPGQRAFRKQLMPTIPVELIAAATDIIDGKLQTISVTGGCATVARAYEEGIVATVRFYTEVGRICGVAQMLKSQHVDGVMKQPFRFLGLEQDNYRRLKAILAIN